MTPRKHRDRFTITLNTARMVLLRDVAKEKKDDGTVEAGARDEWARIWVYLDDILRRADNG